VVLLVALRRLLGPLGLAALVGPLVKMAIASAGSLAAVELLGHWFAPQLHWSGKAGHFALAGLAMAVGLSAYLLLNVALRNTVLIEIWRNEKQARSAAAAPELEAEFATP
jgi:hypothetical protein